MRLSFLFLLLYAIACGCSKDASTNSTPLAPEDLLTRDDEISGWKKAQSSWIAGSSGDLNTYIDGEEPTYTRHGFVEAAMQQYEGRVLTATATIEVRIFDQGSPSGAKALYDEISLQLINPLDWKMSSGDIARIERLPLSQRIVFWKSKHYVSLSITSGLDEGLEVLKTFAGNVIHKIP